MQKNNMMEGEVVICEAQFHYIMFWLPALLAILAVVFPFIPIGEDTAQLEGTHAEEMREHQCPAEHHGAHPKLRRRHRFHR